MLHSKYIFYGQKQSTKRYQNPLLSAKQNYIINNNNNNQVTSGTESETEVQITNATILFIFIYSLLFNKLRKSK